MEAARIQERVPAEVRDFLTIFAETPAKHEVLMRVWRMGYDQAVTDAIKAKLKELT
jgi:hypothetical protein